MVPRIGVFPFLKEDGTLHERHQLYLDAVERSGGRAETIPLKRDETVFARYDGLLFTGGADIAPAFYGQERIPEGGAGDRWRDDAEYAMMRLALERDFPTFGICRGFQMMNVALGGTLWQDLPTQRPSAIRHSIPDDPAYHGAELAPFLREIMGRTHSRVNSYHHQGIREPAPGLEIAAWAEDGLAEAVFAPGKRCFFAVQWHPEKDFDENEASRRLFAAWLQGCR